MTLKNNEENSSSLNLNASLAPVFQENAQGDVTQRKYDDTIVLYDTATPEQKEEMDKLIASIDPADVNTLAVYGKEISDQLSESARAIIEEAKKNEYIFKGLFEKIQESVTSLDGKALKKHLAEMKKRADRELSLKKIDNPIKRMIIRVKSKANPSKAEQEKLIMAINTSLITLDMVMETLNRANDKVPEANANIDTLGRARLASHARYGVYVGAAIEAYKRLKEEVPALEEQAKTSAEARVKLRERSDFLLYLNQTITNMATFHAISYGQCFQLADMKRTICGVQLKIGQHINQSRGQLEMLIAESQITVTTSTLLDTVKKADQFGDSIYMQVGAMSDINQKRVLSALAHGSIDGQKVIEDIEKRIAQITTAAGEVQLLHENFENLRDNLMKTEAKLKEAAEKPLLLSTPSEKPVAAIGYKK